jgi:biopolymer transport protein ExbD
MQKRKHDAGPGGVNLGLIITPMLDMSFQILSFFIMTYHPSALEGHIPGSLLPPETVLNKSEKPPPKMDIIPESVPEDALLPELQEAMTVKITSSPKGTPDGLVLKSKIEDRLVLDSSVTWEKMKQDLEAELRRIQKDAGAEKVNIKIGADGDLRQEYVLQVYDVCKRAGFSKVHFIPPPLLRVEK